MQFDHDELRKWMNDKLNDIMAERGISMPRTSLDEYAYNPPTTRTEYIEARDRELRDRAAEIRDRANEIAERIRRNRARWVSTPRDVTGIDIIAPANIAYSDRVTPYKLYSKEKILHAMHSLIDDGEIDLKDIIELFTYLSSKKNPKLINR